MCDGGQQPSVLGTVREATELMLAGLRQLAKTDFSTEPTAVQAECLRALEQAASVHVAARSAALTAFSSAGGYEDDGHGTARTWLRWQTRITEGAASAATAWARRLAAHTAVRDALAGERISASWARQICEWTDQLPASARDDADLILLAAAAGGAELADLAVLADQLRRKLAPPDRDGRMDPDDRQVRVQTTIGGAGRLEGDLSPGCAEAIRAVLDSLGKRTGPEDKRTERQRHHDALEDACRRLIAAGGLPDRAGQPTQIQLHINLSDLTRDSDVAPTGGPASEGGGPAAPGAAAMPGDECDATIAPIVTGHVDHDLLARLTRTLIRPRCRSCGASSGPGAYQRLYDQVRDLILNNAVALLSGPAGLAAHLRRDRLTGPAGSVSLPLDVGRSTDTIPPYLRRAVITRDQHCAAPGCLRPPSGCQVHHLTPKSRGGETRLTNLVLLCAFHHLIAVHQWGWTITLNADGTTTMRSPDGSRVYHSHSPPASSAA